MIYYVETNGNDKSVGTKDAPFRTINHAAQIAVAGDTVRVGGGEYREWVSPKNGGKSDFERIVYEAVAGETPVIKGSEIVTDWERVEKTVWKKTLPNSLFGDFNPFATPLFGDWLVVPDTYDVHLGDVYINGVSMYEAPTKEALYKAEMRTEGHHYPSTTNEVILHPELTIYQWYAEVEDNTTTLWCNFGEYDPSKELIEINVRKACFFPKKNGVNYITVRGFEMAHAATQFAPPTTAQEGMIGPNWSKGWIIENNHFHDAKCSAVSLGKEITTGDNEHTRFLHKSGYHHQMEAVFKALQAGWCKEKIGSHIVRNNEIHDCGQTGIVGHMGCIFSIIEHNHIYNIAKKQEFWGHEIAGIKLHAAIDVILKNNNIHHCNLGTWLDWQAQGTRLTANLYHNNNRDLMIEVTHGPCLIDNNIFMSPYAFQDAAQGTAFVHNIICGYTRQYAVLDRATPYHFPHSTQVLGTALVHGGDNRIYNNIVLANNKPPKEKCRFIGEVYDSFTTYEEYVQAIRSAGIRHDHAKYMETKQSIWAAGNVYKGYAEPFRAEIEPLCITEGSVAIQNEGDKWILSLSLPREVLTHLCVGVTTVLLGTPRHSEEPYENPDGSPVDFSVDLLGNQRDNNVLAGPFAHLTEGTQEIVVWKK